MSRRRGRWSTRCWPGRSRGIARGSGRACRATGSSIATDLRPRAPPETPGTQWDQRLRCRESEGTHSAVSYADVLREQASAKRELAASMLKLIGFLSSGEDRAVFRRQAAELEADAVLLIAQADRRLAALTGADRSRTGANRPQDTPAEPA